MSSNRFLFNIVKEKPLLIASIVFFSFSGAIFNGVGTALLVPIIVVFLGGQEQLNLPDKPAILKNVISLFDRFEGDQKLLAMIGVVVVIIIFKNLNNYASIMIGSYYSKYLVKRLRLEGIKLLLEVGLDFFAKHKVGDILSQINREISNTASAVKDIVKIFINAVTILTFIYFLLAISWQLTLFSTLLIAIVAFANQYFVISSRRQGKTLTNKAKETTNKIMEILLGMRLIKTVSNEEYEQQEITKLIEERERAELKVQSIAAISGPFNEISGIVTILLLIVIGRYLFAEQIQEYATVLLTYLIILFRLLPFVGQLNKIRNQFASHIPSVEVAMDLLRRDNKPFLSSGNRVYTNLKTGIEFEQVSFAYPGQDKIVLKGIDLWIPKGKTVALVGASGAGKSTIADLLPRFYDPINGRIKVDGIDLREYNLKTFRQAMGIVSQDTFLFNNTVRYNIAYGLHEVMEEEIIAAAKRANAYEFITQLTQGLETEIGDRGVMLSGGQRQRIAIARALLRNPDILILDEATSALDTVSERLVQEAIDELCRDRTTLVIAHRLSTVQKAYQIVVLDQGKVVEVGNHKELLAKNGYYARLYSMQFQDQPQSTTNNGKTEACDLDTHFSYEIRNHLNSLLGSLRLVNEGLIDDQQEHYQLMDEAYQVAQNMLDTLKVYERHLRNNY